MTYLGGRRQGCRTLHCCGHLASRLLYSILQAKAVSASDSQLCFLLENTENIIHDQTLDHESATAAVVKQSPHVGKAELQVHIEI